jgi:hypothetical protein
LRTNGLAKSALKVQLFIFLLVGELAAFLGMSGALGADNGLMIVLVAIFGPDEP